MRFDAEAGSDHHVTLDAAEHGGGQNAGFRPMELLLVGLGGCTGMDVISILRKKRQQVIGYEVHVSGIRAEDHPMVFVLEDWLHKQGLRDKTEMHYLYPLPRVFPIENVAEVATPLLEERNVNYTIFFNTEAVDTEHKTISSMEGEEIPYDLLVLVPPHRGAKVIEDSGLGDEQGWLPTDRATLEVKGQQHIYALGDATDLPVSKSGSAAHFEAKVVAHRLIAEIHGEEPKNGEATYDGEVMCFLETGQNRATQLVFNYEHPPHPPHPSLYYHMEKQLFNRAYWHLVPQGLV